MLLSTIKLTHFEEKKKKSPTLPKLQFFLKYVFEDFIKNYAQFFQA